MPEITRMGGLGVNSMPISDISDRPLTVSSTHVRPFRTSTKRGTMSTETTTTASVVTFTDFVDTVVGTAINGVVSDTALQSVTDAYNALDRSEKGICRASVKSAFDGAMAASDMDAAKSYWMVQSAMHATKPASTTIDADPTDVVQNRISVLLYAARVIGDGSGATVNGADYGTAWVNAVDDVENIPLSDMPDTFRRAVQRVADVPISYGSHDVGAHIWFVMQSHEIGEFVSVGTIATTSSPEFPDAGNALRGRIQARLFPTSGKCTVDGIRPVKRDETPAYGAIRTV